MDDVLVLSKRLSDPDPDPAPWPHGLALRPFGPSNAPGARALLNAAYARGGGDVAPFGPWWEALLADPEYDPDLCLVLEDTARSAVVGFAHCWTSAFVKDLAVDEALRGRGLGRGLMLRAFRLFRERGVAEVRLKVRRDNPSGAPAFYRSLGMDAVRP